ncbi:MAG: hypothetical protein ACI9R3_001204 [Verrucomicrobiales bacterium]|jgi:hypothetical protein
MLCAGYDVPRWIDALQQTIGRAPIIALDCGLEDDPAEIAFTLARSKASTNVASGEAVRDQLQSRGEKVL